MRRKEGGCQETITVRDARAEGARARVRRPALDSLTAQLGITHARPDGSAACPDHKQGELPMRRLGSGFLVLLLTLLVTAVGASSAPAASAHFKKGGEPTCTISGSGASSTSTSCTASLSGLGGGDLDINTTVSGFAVYQCRNNGGNIAPGQNRVLVGPVTAPTTIPSGAIKNGNVTFTTNPAVLTAPSTVSGAQAGCPNGNWTGVNPTLTVTSIRLTIAQGDVTLFACTASN